VRVRAIESTPSSKVAKEQKVEKIKNIGDNTTGQQRQQSRNPGNKMANKPLAIASGCHNKNPFLIYSWTVIWPKIEWHECELIA